MGNLIDQIRIAINEKTACRITLTGEAFSRTVHPHGLAVLSSGKTSIVCYQTGGYSLQGSLPGFRHLSFDRCADLVLLDEKFEKNPEFEPEQKMYRRWLIKID